jgi:glycosyltransferase involved in cell wall biosynthesis
MASRRAIRVLVDATSIPPSRGGVARYLDGVLGELSGDGIEVVVACLPREADRLRALAPSAAIHVVSRSLERRPVRLAWEQVGLPLLARRLDADVIHSPHYTLPLLSRRPVAVTLHDATFFTDPTAHGLLKRTFFRTWTRIASRRAAVCIVPSQATEDELRRELPRFVAPFAVAHHGVDPRVFHPPAAEDVRALATRLDPEGRGWIAFLGTIEPRKNVPALIAAYGLLSSTRPRLPVLLLAGARGWDGDVDASVRRLEPDAAAGIGFPGYLAGEELPAFLAGSVVVCYPSLGEGFGLPVLEGMAVGACVVTTDRLALPEVGGDAVVYAPTDAEGLADVLGTVLDDAELRAEMGRRGLERARSFTWARSAAVHRDAFRLAAS